MQEDDHNCFPWNADCFLESTSSKRNKYVVNQEITHQHIVDIREFSFDMLTKHKIYEEMDLSIDVLLQRSLTQTYYNICNENNFMINV